MLMDQKGLSSSGSGAASVIGAAGGMSAGEALPRIILLHLLPYTDVVQFAHAAQFLCYRQDVDGIFVEGQHLNSLKDLLVRHFVERIGLERIGDTGECIGLNHQGTQHGTFQLGSLRLQMVTSVRLAFGFLIPLPGPSCGTSEAWM